MKLNEGDDGREEAGPDDDKVLPPTTENDPPPPAPMICAARTSLLDDDVAALCAGLPRICGDFGGDFREFGLTDDLVVATSLDEVAGGDVTISPF